eukprot:TRINITY_DN1091_c0_g1_i6.p3 TRINITY_DN1091_c0_g1~~TRINITY_DN1091_c0_g1_i6.p3  ORF type:complete len:185 (+),score=23.95 TRINITY_DN1091_c0_g1_i6:840-1394(+)
MRPGGAFVDFSQSKAKIAQPLVSSVKSTTNMTSTMNTSATNTSVTNTSNRRIKMEARQPAGVGGGKISVIEILANITEGKISEHRSSSKPSTKTGLPELKTTLSEMKIMTKGVVSGVGNPVPTWSKIFYGDQHSNPDQYHIREYTKRGSFMVKSSGVSQSSLQREGSLIFSKRDSLPRGQKKYQ